MAKGSALVLFCRRVAPSLAGGTIALAAACMTHAASVEGQVFELVNPDAPPSRWSRLPAANAYVIVTWQGTVPRLGHSGSVCLHAVVGKTDERGRFEVSGSWPPPKEFPVIPREPAVMVYKPGFDPQSDYSSRGAPIVRTLARSKLAAEQRVALLALYAESGCRDDNTFKTTLAGSPHGVADRFYRTLYEEARALGPLRPDLNHHLMSIREKAGVPEPEQPRQIRVIPPQGPRLAPAPPTLPDLSK